MNGGEVEVMTQRRLESSESIRRSCRKKIQEEIFRQLEPMESTDAAVDDNYLNDKIRRIEIARTAENDNYLNDRK